MFNADFQDAAVDEKLVLRKIHHYLRCRVRRKNTLAARKVLYLPITNLAVFCPVCFENLDCLTTKCRITNLIKSELFKPCCKITLFRKSFTIQDAHHLKLYVELFYQLHHQKNQPGLHHEIQQRQHRSPLYRCPGDLIFLQLFAC